MLASIQREYQSYESLSGINENEMALDALIRGYGRCVDGADLAQEYEITDEMAGLKNQICSSYQTILVYRRKRQQNCMR